MAAKFKFFVGLLLLLLLLDHSLSDSEGEKDIESELDPKLPKEANTLKEEADGSKMVLNSSVVDSKKKNREKVSLSEMGVGKIMDTNNSSISGSIEKLKGKDGAEEKEKSKEAVKDIGNGGDGNKSNEVKEKSGESTSETKEVIKKDMVGKEIDVVYSKSRKEGSWSEDCDSSNKCTDEANKLVACLRVPGNESPHLSLLIQNKAEHSLTVTISAPEFVNLKEKNVQLKGKENREMKVSIGEGENGNMIVLTTGNGHCNLDFRELIARNSGKTNSDNLLKVKYIKTYLPRTSFLMIFGCALILSIASAWTCMGIRTKGKQQHVFGGGENDTYERMDMELRVSVGGKLVSTSREGWDESWDDHWDDEEAPRTPSFPVTPSFSSKGLAARRLIKEGWKD